MTQVQEWNIGSFNPKPEAMAGSGIDRPHVAPAIASGFGLNEDTTNRWHCIVDRKRRLATQ